YVVETLQTSGGGGEETETYQVSFAGPLPIPDNQTQGVSADVIADRSPAGRRVLALVDIDHSWKGDLRVSLVAPDGTEVVLHNRTGGSKDDVKGIYGLDLESAEDMAPLSQVTATGTWSLRVSDHARRDVGAIQSFQLQFAP
ncbi:MAG: proprotein convertase P-domain-containing protein, partial [Bdellovibrionales bacterium]|nr:proprotein convertase P-domain-containing protein [Bdellovibrionales bacterium]